MSVLKPIERVLFVAGSDSKEESGLEPFICRSWHTRRRVRAVTGIVAITIERSRRKVSARRTLCAGEGENGMPKGPASAFDGFESGLTARRCATQSRQCTSSIVPIRCLRRL